MASQGPENQPSLMERGHPQVEKLGEANFMPSLEPQPRMMGEGYLMGHTPGRYQWEDYGGEKRRTDEGRGYLDEPKRREGNEWREPHFRDMGGSSWNLGEGDSRVRKMRVPTFEGEEWREPQFRDQGSRGWNWGGDDPRVRKLKMSVFEGEDAHGWVYRVERYFAINWLTEEERLTAAGLCLEGKVLAWYQRREMRQLMRSWEEFKDSLLERFRSNRD